MTKQTFYVMDKTGDTQSEFDTADSVEVEAAMAQFDALMGSGHMAYKPGADGEPGSQIKDYDKTLEKVIFSPSLVGG